MGIFLIKVTFVTKKHLLLKRFLLNGAAATLSASNFPAIKTLVRIGRT